MGVTPILQLAIGGVQTYQLPVANAGRAYTCGWPSGSTGHGVTTNLPTTPCNYTGGTRTCFPYAPNRPPAVPYVVNFDNTPVGTKHTIKAEGAVPYPKNLLSVSSSCLITWDTTNGTAGDLYAAQVTTTIEGWV